MSYFVLLSFLYKRIAFKICLSLKDSTRVIAMLKIGFILISGLVIVAQSKEKVTKENPSPEKGSSGLRMPNVPESLEEFRYAPTFVSIWESRIFELNETTGLLKEEESEDSKPKMILAPTERQLAELLPENAPHPLYSRKYGSLADDFIMDSLSTGILNHEDNRLETPEGHAYQSITGKCLLFKRNIRTQDLTVNGVPVTAIHKTIGKDPVTVLDLDGFLFNHRRDISEAFNALFEEGSELNSKLTTKGQNEPTTSTTTTTPTTASTTTVRHDMKQGNITVPSAAETSNTSISSTSIPNVIQNGTVPSATISSTTNESSTSKFSLTTKQA